MARAVPPAPPEHPPAPAGAPSSGAALSNLSVLPNLLTQGEYQNEIYTCTLAEIIDFSRREPNLFSRERLSGAHRYEFVAQSGPVTRPIPRLEPDGRAVRWLEVARERVPAAVSALETRADLEVAVELLVVTRQVYHLAEDEPARRRAAGWDLRVCAVLARPEFHLTPELIEQRLEMVLGRALVNPNPTSEPAPEPPRPARARIPEPVVGRTPVAPAPAEEPAALAPGGAGPAVEAANDAAELAPVSPPPDDGLARVNARWADLPDQVKFCIRMLIEAAGPARREQE